MTLDPESLRIVLDVADVRLQELQVADDSPRRVAFDEVARAVGWVRYPETDSRADFPTGD